MNIIFPLPSTGRQNGHLSFLPMQEGWRSRKSQMRTRMRSGGPPSPLSCTMSRSSWYRDLLGGAPKEIGPVINQLYHVFQKKDALLAEINPLVTTPAGVFAADAKLIVDDNALRRQGITVNRDLTDREREAEHHGFSYVELDGTIRRYREWSRADDGHARPDRVLWRAGPQISLTLGAGLNRNV